MEVASGRSIGFEASLKSVNGVLFPVSHIPVMSIYSLMVSFVLPRLSSRCILEGGARQKVVL